MFYEFKQNNSGGSFVVDSTICHRMVIEANNEEDAIDRAEKFGCYWDGVESGYDCKCCGDRWYNSPDIISLITSVYENIDKEISDEDAILKFEEKYNKYNFSVKPVVNEKIISNKKYRNINASILFNSIEDTMQYMSNIYGSTSPAARIFYLNGEIKEIYRNV